MQAYVILLVISVFDLLKSCFYELMNTQVSTANSGDLSPFQYICLPTDFLSKLFFRTYLQHLLQRLMSLTEVLVKILKYVYREPHFMSFYAPLENRKEAEQQIE